MNRSAVEKFAVKARRELQRLVSIKLSTLGITADEILPAKIAGDFLIIDEHPFPKSISQMRKRLTDEVKSQGYDELVTTVAYTWFNRFCALRFMEVHDYIPYRVFTSSTGNNTPDIVNNAIEAAKEFELPKSKLEEIMNLKLHGGKDNELYRMLIIGQCNHLAKALPFLFQNEDDYSELLLPDNLLQTDSIIKDLTNSVDESDWNEIEILGWLYQYYISEKKDEVIGKTVKKEDIPAATQLFTPNWIVRYMVDNSLGRLWMLNNQTSTVKSDMEYYIEPEEVRSGKWKVESEPVGSVGRGKEENNYGSEELQRTNRVAESNGLDGDHLSGNKNISKGRDLRADISDSKSSSLDTIEHSRRSGKEINCGIQKFSINSSGFQSGGGDTNNDCSKTELHFSDTDRENTEFSRRNKANDIQSSIKTKLTSHSSHTLHSPLPTPHLRISSPEEIRLIDPACGSGHILVYAFDLLFKIYEEHGYIGRDIPALILEHNLYGIDIDKRAAQLAAFALMMKARSKDRRFFTREVSPKIIEIKESNDFDTEGLKELTKSSNNSDIDKNRIESCAEFIKRIFTDAKNYGSLQRIPDSLSKQLPEIKKLLQSLNQDDFLFGAKSLEKLNELIKQAEFLSTKYEVCVANPPYMGSKGMNKQVKDFAKDEYPDSKSDLFAMFIERNLDFAINKGYSGMITMQSWMFLSSYEKLRNGVLNKHTILTMPHLGTRAFDSIGGEVVSTTSFVIQNSHSEDYRGQYIRLIDGNNETEKKQEFKSTINQQLATSNYHTASASDFKKIPGSPIAYWVSNTVIDIFKEKQRLDEIAPVKVGLQTGNNEMFVREWFEISNYKTSINSKGTHDFSKKWFPYNKGGEYRKWYGNNENVVNWQNKGNEIQNFTDEKGKLKSRPQNRNFYFKESISWSFVSSTKFGARFSDTKAIFDVGGSSAFPSINEKYFLTGLLCSTISNEFLKAMNPTLNFQVGNVASLPIVRKTESKYNEDLIRSIISSHKTDWNNFETSWDFTYSPILREELIISTLKGTWQNYWNYYQDMTSEMLKLEEENNCIFIEAYGLQDELTPEVPLKEITLTGNPVYRYGDGKTEEEYKTRMLIDTMKEFLSYGVGCMMGRYSIDRPGLILANQGETVADYISKVESVKCKVKSEESGERSVKCEVKSEMVEEAKLSTSHSSLPTPSFMPDDDGIVPVIDQAYFEDDCAERFVEFLTVTFGKEKLEENLHFLVDGLGLKGSDSPVEKLRKYFSTQFFKDHMKRYKKRPIYWLMSSGKEKAFQCLIYMHRYTPSTLARIRTSYVHELQSKLATREKDLPDMIESASTTSEANKLKKEQSTVKKKIAELAKFDEELRHLADQRIEIDLDDGVKRNYGLFGNLLAEKKAITGIK